ncbi:MAG: SPOR domain-containing protein [Muribaculaceae bacterium]|nr:SPOR domain-containing protein [Muribaculaceae bacterium]
MKLYIPAAVAAAMMLPALFSCKTTEANYRAAYERTIEARQQQEALDSTIYGAHRRAMGSATVNTADGAVEVRTQLVRVTPDGGGSNERLHRFNVVVGQFKQLFNAKSLRERLADGGYPGAFVVQTAEPYYYIVLASFDNASEAKTCLEQFAATGTISMKAPCPFILDATARAARKHTH